MSLTSIPIRFVPTAMCVALLGLCQTLPCAWLSPVRGIEPDAVQAIANGTTVCIIRIDTANLQMPRLAHMQQLEPLIDDLRNAVGGQSVYVAIDLPYRPNTSFVRIAVQSQGIQPNQLAQLMRRYSDRHNLSQPRQVDTWTFVDMHGRAPSSEQTTKTISTDMIPVDRERWTAALNGRGGDAIQIAVVPPTYLRAVYDELDPMLPAMLGGGSGRVFSAGLQWLHFGCDPSRMKAKLLVQSDTPPAAQALAAQIPKMLRGMIEHSEATTDESKSVLLAMVALVQLQVEGNQITWRFEETKATEQLLSLANTVSRSITVPLAANQVSNNLKQLGLSCHNYVDTFQSFPPHDKVRDANGQSGLSWRVHVLPFIDQTDLYKQFKLDEPWDSEHNIKLLDKMPQIYAPATILGEAIQIKPFHTLVTAPIGDKTIFGGDKPVTFGMISDGSSNTIMFVELAPEHAIPWTSPEEYRFDPKNPAAKLYARNGKVLTAWADGSVRALQIDNTPETWNALFSMHGGEITDEK